MGTQGLYLRCSVSDRCVVGLYCHFQRPQLLPGFLGSDRLDNHAHRSSPLPLITPRALRLWSFSMFAVAMS